LDKEVNRMGLLSGIVKYKMYTKAFRMLKNAFMKRKGHRHTSR